MRNILAAAAAATVLALPAAPALADTSWWIGDDDGYGMGLPDNADHPFNGSFANYDGRSDDEKAATNGAQFTDTYSTTQPGYSPHGDLTQATFIFTNLGTGWTQGSMWFDMADFQASTFGAVKVTYNGILQDWAFNDGFPTTKVRFFNLSDEVLDSINASGELVIVIDRNASADFYGFDYAKLSNVAAVPEPSTYALMAFGLAGVAAIARRRRR